MEGGMDCATRGYAEPALCPAFRVNGCMSAALGACCQERRALAAVSEGGKRRRTTKGRLCASRARRKGTVARLSASQRRSTSRPTGRRPAPIAPSPAAKLSPALKRRAGVAASYTFRRALPALSAGSGETARKPATAAIALAFRQTFRARPTEAIALGAKAIAPSAPTRRPTQARPANETGTALASSRVRRLPNVI